MKYILLRQALCRQLGELPGDDTLERRTAAYLIALIDRIEGSPIEQTCSG